MVDSGLLPGIGINVFLMFFVESNLVLPMRMARRINNAGVVATIGQYES